MSEALKWLRTSGSAVVTQDGTPVRLRGVGVGGWLNADDHGRQKAVRLTEEAEGE